MSKITSKHATKSDRHFVVLDSGRRFQEQLGKDRTFLVSRIGELDDAFVQSSRNSVWIMMRPVWTERLIRAALTYSLQHQRQGNVFGDLLMLQPPPRSELLPSLRSYFRNVIGEVSSFKTLPRQRLAEVLSGVNQADRFIGGVVDETSGTLTLWRGNLEVLVVPLAIFRSSGPNKPDFQQFELDDYGYAIRFGPYEASAHSVLFNVDPDYRRRYNEQRKAEEKGFGPSLRRLRILRGLSRDDFPDISGKTIARIERGETGKPQGKTLGKLAKTLGVAPEEIETY